jgi:hypothetical protein
MQRTSDQEARKFGGGDQYNWVSRRLLENWKESVISQFRYDSPQSNSKSGERRIPGKTGYRQGPVCQGTIGTGIGEVEN